jgi:hypothetical protein
VQYLTLQTLVYVVYKVSGNIHMKGILSFLLPDLKLFCIYLRGLLKGKFYGSIHALKVI